MSLLGFAAAGALSGAGEGMVSQAKSEREAALEALRFQRQKEILESQQEFSAGQSELDRGFRRGERLETQDFTAQQNAASRAASRAAGGSSPKEKLDWAAALKAAESMIGDTPSESRPEDIRTLARDLYNEANGLEAPLAASTGASAVSGPPTPTTQEEYDALPPGTEYTGRDGKLYTKDRGDSGKAEQTNTPPPSTPPQEPAPKKASTVEEEAAAMGGRRFFFDQSGGLRPDREFIVKKIAADNGVTEAEALKRIRGLSDPAPAANPILKSTLEETIAELGPLFFLDAYGKPRPAADVAIREIAEKFGVGRAEILAKIRAMQ